MKIIIFFISILISNSSKNNLYCQNNDNRHFNASKTCINYIKNDFYQRYHVDELKDSLIYNESPFRIEINLRTVCDDLIRQDYFSGDSIAYKKAMVLNKTLIKQVQDSLNIVNKMLNGKCKVSEKKSSKIEKKSNQVICFFSQRCGNLVYVEAIPSRGVIETGNGQYPTFSGEALTYLFIFNDSKKSFKVYKGEIFYD